MIELTIEQKAKRYEEALERAKNLHKDAIDMGNSIRAKQCEIIFPELKESEDKKIRKELTEFLKSASEGRLDILTPYKTFGKWLTWLENQSEQKPADWSEEDEYIIEEIEAIIDAYVLEEYNPKALKNWLKSLKERIGEGGG